MSRRPKPGNSTAAARMANHDLMDNPPYLGAGGATNVELEDDLSGNMLETCIDDTVSLSDPKEGSKHVSVLLLFFLYVKSELNLYSERFGLVVHRKIDRNMETGKHRRCRNIPLFYM